MYHGLYCLGVHGAHNTTQVYGQHCLWEYKISSEPNIVPICALCMIGIKMVADPVHAKEASLNFVRYDDVFCNSQCQCCSLSKRDFQVFVNEIKIND
jgi:hypothetical protein